MKSDYPDCKVIYRDFSDSARSGGAVAKPHLAASQAPCGSSRQRVIEHLKKTFKGIVRNAADAGWIEAKEGEGYYDPRRPQYGAYGSYIGYYADGRPNFFLRHEIDRVKAARPYTRNAIEMRCDALGLAIYVSGITQINPSDKTASEGVKVVIYNHVNLKPASVLTVKSAEELVDKLHHILVTTYNLLAREYNLAGYTADFLTLTSSHKALPSISIDMQG